MARDIGAAVNPAPFLTEHERERFEHLVLGRDRPIEKQIIKRQGRKRTIKAPVVLSPGIEEGVQLRERWSHKAKGTPETHDKHAAAMSRPGAIARLHGSGAIDDNQLAWAEEIAAVAELIQSDVTIRTARLDMRVDGGGRGCEPVAEGIGRVRREMAYTRWRLMLPYPKRLVLDMILGDAIGFTIAARRHGVHWRKARRYLIDALDRWPECLDWAFKQVDAAELAAAQAGLL